MLLLKFRGIVCPEHLDSVSESLYVFMLFKAVDLWDPVIVRLSHVRIISLWLLWDRQIIVVIILKTTTENMLINTNI